MATQNLFDKTSLLRFSSCLLHTNLKGAVPLKGGGAGLGGPAAARMPIVARKGGALGNGGPGRGCQDLSKMLSALTAEGCILMGSGGF